MARTFCERRAADQHVQSPLSMETKSTPPEAPNHSPGPSPVDASRRAKRPEKAQLPKDPNEPYRWIDDPIPATPDAPK